MAIPINQLPIGEGRHPNGDLGASFFMDRTRVEEIEKDGPASKFDDSRFVREAVGQPDAIFQGLEQANKPGILCYSVRPTHDPDEPEAQTLPRYGFAFLVFAQTGIGGYVVFDWTWRKEDPDEPGHPHGWQDDFTRRTWNRPSTTT